MVAVSVTRLVLLAAACASTASLASAAPSRLTAVAVPRSDAAVLSAPAGADQASASSTKTSKRVKGRKSKKSKSKKGGKGKGDKKKKHHNHDSRFAALNDPMNPVAQTAQSFFQVVSKAAARRAHRRSSSPEPRHHRHHHHHHNDDHHHHHYGDDDKVIVNGDHDHVHVHRRQSSVVIPGEDEDNDQTYVVHSERDVSDPEGSIQVVTSDQKRMGDLWYDDSKDTMFVSSTNHTTFQLHCAEDLMCQLITLMYDEAAAKVVERCMSYGGEEDGKMGFDECDEGGANQTFRYEESSGVVKPVMVNSMASGNDTTTTDPGAPQNGTTAASVVDTVEHEETLHDDEFIEESQLGARDDVTPPSGSTNVSLVFVPKYPNAPNTKAAATGNDTSSALQKDNEKDSEEHPSSAATYTVTETVTVSSGSESATGDASKTVMNAAAATTTASSSFASVSESSSSLSSSASTSASMGDDWEVEVHQAANSGVPTTTPAPSSDASTPSSSVDASSIASRIAVQSADSTINASPTPTSSGANANQLKFRADRLW